MTDRLVQIQYTDLPTLKKLYTSDATTSHIGYMTIDIYTQLLAKNPDEHKYIKFYCLNGDFSDGTYIVTERGRAYADTLNESFDNLHRLVQLIDYSNGFMFLSIRDALGPVILDALQKANIEPVFAQTTLLYHMSKEDALKFTAERDDVQLRPLTEIKDIEKADLAWPHRNSTSLKYLQRLVKCNANIGAFKRDGTLVAWILRFSTGLLGILQTDEKFYGQGYGGLVLKHNSKTIAEMGHDVYAGVFEANTPSRALFDKLGFKPVSQVYWIKTPNAFKIED